MPCLVGLTHLLVHGWDITSGAGAASPEVAPSGFQEPIKTKMKLSLNLYSDVAIHRNSELSIRTSGTESTREWSTKNRG